MYWAQSGYKIKRSDHPETAWVQNKKLYQCHHTSNLKKEIGRRRRSHVVWTTGLNWEKRIYWCRERFVGREKLVKPWQRLLLKFNLNADIMKSKMYSYPNLGSHVWSQTLRPDCKHQHHCITTCGHMRTNDWTHAIHSWRMHVSRNTSLCRTCTITHGHECIKLT